MVIRTTIYPNFLFSEWALFVYYFISLEYLKRFEKHIFICENERPAEHPRGCCNDKNSKVIREKFKTRLKELGLNSIIRANGSLCLDACEFGPTIVVYPDQIWYGAVTANDVEEIIHSHLINNKPVERLLIKDSRFYQDDIK